MALGRDRAWIVEQAVRRFLAEEQAFLAAVRQGQADIEAGRFITDDEMEASLDRIEAELATRQ
jgi:predicted transcriptional regulator